MKKIFLAGVSALTASVLLACGGGSSNSGSNNSSSESVNGIPSSFVGVWDTSIDEGVLGFDESYITIDASGKVSVYDFAGDTFDDWGNCYWIYKDALQLTHLGGSKYRSTQTYPGTSGESEEIVMVLSGGVLTTTAKDVDDMDGDGNTTEDYTETLKKSSRTVQSFSPECVDSFAAARSLIPAKKTKSNQIVQ